MRRLQHLVRSSRMIKQIWQVRQLHVSSILMTDKHQPAFDLQLLDILACPLSKKPLRYDQTKDELVCDEIGVAYPIVNGIPNLNPIHGRMLNKDSRQGGENNSNDRK